MYILEVDLRHVEYFLAVGTELHFRRAAERMMVSQTAITYHIHKLEEEIGVLLLERNKRRVTLTAAGEAFARGSQRAMAESEAAVREARRIGRGDSRKIAVAANASLFARVVPSVTRAMMLEDSRLHVTWRTFSPAEAIDAVRQRRVDVALTTTNGLVLGGDLHAETFLRQQLLLAIPRHSGLASVPRVKLAALAHEDAVCISDATGGVSAEYVRRLCRSVGIVPNVRHEADGMQAVLAAVAAEQGVALVPALARDLQRVGVIYRPIEGLRERISFELVWHRDVASTTWLQAFRRGATQAVANRPAPESFPLQG